MKKPLAILISDQHWSLGTLEIAKKAFRLAIDKAAELKVPLFDLGDLHNDKAILRGEVMNSLIKTMEYAQFKGVDINLIIGNHSLLNEKAPEHALNFLDPYVKSITDSIVNHDGIYLIAYNSHQDAFKECFNHIPRGSLVFCHQGFKGAFMGDYIQDRSSVDPLLFKDYKIFSGHYHKHQQIGPVTYVGNPYTLTFGESNDGTKGFLILYDDMSFTREILDLRKHVILTVTPDTIVPVSGINSNDLLWLKVEGKQEQLAKLNKVKIGELLLGHSNYKLDLIPIDIKNTIDSTENLSGEQLLDQLIDKEEKYKPELKKLWRHLL